MAKAAAVLRGFRRAAGSVQSNYAFNQWIVEHRSSVCKFLIGGN
jgi:hypothetical protein